MPEGHRTRAQYRPDVDGLRALAVLLVLGCHLHVPHLAGGYIGVDVFFVISGYLISGIIMPQVTTGTFSLVDFYARRVRRIVPALFVMLAASIALAWRYLLPTETVDYAVSLLASVFACSNTLLWSWHGYFDQANNLKPLLHTWSLGVEEQFYLLFPLLLLLIAKLRRPAAVRVAIWTLTLADLVAACALVYSHPHPAFFNVALRSWELLLGALLSQRYLPVPRNAVQRNLAAFAGLALILVPAFAYTSEIIFPGLTALAPCLGALLLIAAGETGASIPGRLLSLRPIVFIGLISYSLYLWHWPVEVFAQLRHLQNCTPGSCALPVPLSQQAVVFAIALILATLSWRFVETPVRTGPHRPTRRTLFLGSALAAALLTAAAFALIATHGAASRFTPQAIQAASYLGFDTNLSWRWNSCALGLDHTTLETFDRRACLPFTPGHTHYLLLGDSHAAHLWPGFAQTFPDLQIGQANVAGCTLLPARQSDDNPTCRDMARFVYRDLLPSGQVSTVIVSAFWRPTDFPDIAALAGFTRAHNIRLILLGPTPDYDIPLPRLLAQRLNAALIAAHADAAPALLDAQMSILARTQWHVDYISFFTNLCPTASSCPTYAAPGVPLLLDTNHFTPAGATLFTDTLRKGGQLP